MLKARTSLDDLKEMYSIHKGFYCGALGAKRMLTVVMMMLHPVSVLEVLVMIRK